VAAALRAHGAFHRANLGQFVPGNASLDFLAEVGGERSHEMVLKKNDEIFASVRGRIAALLDGLSTRAASRAEG
jgi:hypothetical protein